MLTIVVGVRWRHLFTQHAVIHRDIKPDNIMIKNICLSDRSSFEGEPNEPQWPELIHKWHLTLIDFGFARALSRKDLEVEESIKTRIKNIMQKERYESLDHPVEDRSRGYFQSQEVKNANDASRHIVRALSALGTQRFAAPEVKNKARHSDSADESSHKTFNATLASNVSDYGMIADAFSVGATARYVLTGVPPNESVEVFVANHNNPMNKAARWIGRKLAKKAETKPKKTYRPSSGLPLEALHLVKGLTQPNASIRTSVRDAMRYPYIHDVLGATTTFKKEITFLKCAQS
jgi:serine/threonine protein kinase